MSKELAKRPETQIAENKVIAGMENIDHEDIVLPSLYPDAKMGYFRDSLDERSKKDEIEGVLLTYNKGWKFRQGDPPKTVCRSFFGDVGTFGTACEGCPKRVKNPDSKDYCKRVYDFLFVPDGQSMPTIISITQITSLGNIKKYLTLFAKKLQVPLFTARTKLSLVETKNPKGQTYFVVQFEKLDNLSLTEQKKYLDIMTLYRMNKPVEDVEPKTESEDIDQNCPF